MRRPGTSLTTGQGRGRLSALAIDQTTLTRNGG
jgi:hypothetical protein